MADKIQTHHLTAYFGKVRGVHDINMNIQENQITAIIGPSGCGKSTFVRCLNRMHEVIVGAYAEGEVILDGDNIYAPERDPVQVRRRIGMVFQKPTPFPTMSIEDNVAAGLKLNGITLARADRDRLVEQSLRRAALWEEVKDRLGRPGASLSGGQQQRLCVARALAVEPEVLLMDEPCSALDPTSTRRIEETIGELRTEVTIVIVTHNMQQAARVSQQAAFFLAEQGSPGAIVESGPTEGIFEDPKDQRTADYVHGRFG